MRPEVPAGRWERKEKPVRKHLAVAIAIVLIALIATVASPVLAQRPEGPGPGRPIYVLGTRLVYAPVYGRWGYAGGTLHRVPTWWGPWGRTRSSDFYCYCDPGSYTWVPGSKWYGARTADGVTRYSVCRRPWWSAEVFQLGYTD